MKLSSITIKNYRALDEITLSLNPCMNVLYGTNGAGKSSILYALHDFLGLLFSQEIAPPDFRLFPGRAVREHNRDTAIGLCFSNGCTVSATLRPDVVYREPVTVASGWRQSCQLADGTRISHFPDFDVHACSFFPGKSQDNIDAKFLPTPSSLELRVQERPPLSFNRGASYLGFKESFERQENRENQKRIRNSDYRDPVLEKIRKALSTLLDGFQDITIDREQKGYPLCILKNGRLMDVAQQMSSGEANIVSLVGQIVLNVHAAQDKNIPCIVLIDEIDNSLHPQWQVKICNLLKKAFPDVQFIVSSHSPFVWSELNRDEVIWLERDSEGKVVRKPVDYAKGGRIWDIIGEYFGVAQYGRDFADEVHAIDALIEQGDADAARKTMSEMRDRYGNLPILSRLEFHMRVLGL